MTIEPQHEPEESLEQDDAVIGVAFKWSILVIIGIAIIVVLVLALSGGEEPERVTIDRDPIQPPPPVVTDTSAIPAVHFTDITTGAGIDFKHESGATGEKLLPETMGAGAAFFDYDNDGDQDVLLINSARWPEQQNEQSARSVLYANDGRGSFADVTEQAGLIIECYGQGCAIADVDGNGWRDVFVTTLGRNRLFLNFDGRFEERTEESGLAGAVTMWSTSAGFFDYDRDGDLDLFVCNYVQWSRQLDYEIAYSINGVDRAYGPPTSYRGTHSYLYRNDGQATFTDVSAQAGIEVTNPATGEPMGKALAVTFVDVDADGWQDILVANDTVQNFMFRNRTDGSFAEVGALSGVGFDAAGSATGAMGMDVGELRDDGRLAIAIANFANETTSLYAQQRGDPWQFADVANAEGVGSPSRLKLSFGLFFCDYDLDGRLDLFQANGHLEETINDVQPSQHYRQAAQLFWNCGAESGACFKLVPESITGALADPMVARGAAYADIDGDGDLDFLLTQTGEPPRLLRNESALAHHWLRVKLRGAAPNTDAIGAVVECTVAGATLRRTVMPTRSYLSQVELPLTFGLGEATRIESLRITWPDGSEQTVVSEVDQTITIDQPG